MDVSTIKCNHIHLKFNRFVSIFGSICNRLLLIIFNMIKKTFYHKHK